MRKSTTALILATTAAMLLAGCSASGGGSSDEPIVLGASLQLSGFFAPAGADQKLGLEQAVSDVNAAGGIEVGGVKRPLELKLVDNRTDVALATDQVRSLILEDEVDGIIGSCATDFIVPTALLAEQYGVPFLSGCMPNDQFAAGNSEGWTFAHNIYYNSSDVTEAVVSAIGLVETNKKVALLTDTTVDGTTYHDYYTKALEAAGFDIVSESSFPIGTTDFSGPTREAMDAGAGVVIAVAVPGDGFALAKQFAAFGYKPEVMAVNKAADAFVWTEALGDLGEGALGVGFWAEDDRGPGSDALVAALGDVPVPNIETPAVTYALVEIFAKAITAAGGTDHVAVNDAILAFDGDTVVGTVKWTDDNYFALPLFVYQWQSGVAVQVFPEVGNELLVPVAGLQ